MNRQTLRILLPFAVTTLVLMCFLPRNAKFGYEYSKGKEWKYDNLFAEFDFPILKTEEQMERESYKAGATVPYFRLSPEVAGSSMRRIESKNLGPLKQDVISVLQGIYDRGVVPDGSAGLSDGQSTADVIYIQNGRRAQKFPSAEILTVEGARSLLLSVLRGMDCGMDVDSLLIAQGVYDLVEPNLFYDQQTTELISAEASSAVSPTQGFMKAGQPIVSQGEIVTAEIAQILDSYKREYEATVGYDGPRYLLWLGNGVMALALVAFLFFAIFFTRPQILRKSTKLYYILLIYLIFALAPLVICRFREDLLYMFPFALAALYLHAFFRPRVIFSVYITTLLPMLVFTSNGVILFTMYLVAGAVAIYAFHYLNHGWKQFLAALITFAVVSSVYVGFHWIGAATANVARILLYLLCASLLTVFLYPLIYLFERLFNLVSDSRLMELCDTSNSLVRELEKRAPGTFQHSLQVMNMADTVARAIDANPNLVRAGALYHDIGKMNNPQCFIENESLIQKEDSRKYHAGLSPKQSAADILKHVSEGYEMAQKHGLPHQVSDFIITHHGTSVTGYFYNRFIKEGGSPDEKGEFQYAGRKPVSKEQVILMLCDTVEAASRTLTDHSPEAFDSFVEGIVSSKLRDGQLDDTEISISELGIVKAELKNYLAQVYHERIVYPKR